MNNSRDPQNAYLKNLKSRIDRKFVEGVNFVDIRLPSFNNRKILNFITENALFSFENALKNSIWTKQIPNKVVKANLIQSSFPQTKSTTQSPAGAASAARSSLADCATYLGVAFLVNFHIRLTKTSV